MLTKAYVNAVAFLESLKKDERGVTAIEYAIVAVAIAGVVALVFNGTNDNGLQKALENAFSAITKIIGDVTPKGAE